MEVLPPLPGEKAIILDKIKTTTQITIDQFTIVKKINQTHLRNELVTSGSLTTSLMGLQVSGKWPKCTANITKSGPRPNSLLDGQLESVNAEKTPTILDQSNQKYESSQAASQFYYWDSLLKFQQIKRGYWNLIGCTELMVSQCNYSDPSKPICNTQKFDDYGALLANGISNGQVIIFDTEEVKAKHRNQHQRINKLETKNPIVDCSLNVNKHKEREGFSFKKDDESEQKVAYFPPEVLRFMP